MRVLHRFRGTAVLAGFLLATGFLLVTEHRAHAFGLLPLLILLACPLMHLLSHGRHGGHRHDRSGDRPDPPAGTKGGRP